MTDETIQVPNPYTREGREFMRAVWDFDVCRFRAYNDALQGQQPDPRDMAVCKDFMERYGKEDNNGNDNRSTK